MANNELNGTKVAILAADGVERVELEEPRTALLRAGVTVVDQEVSIDGNLITSRNPTTCPRSARPW